MPTTGPHRNSPCTRCVPASPATTLLGTRLLVAAAQAACGNGQDGHPLPAFVPPVCLVPWMGHALDG